MRVLCLVTWLALLSACSSFGVRCDSRLRPINPRQSSPTLPRARISFGQPPGAKP